MFFKKRFEQKRVFVLDTCILLNELRFVKKLIKTLKKEKKCIKIIIPYAALQEVRGMYFGIRQKIKMGILLGKDEAKRFRLSRRAWYFLREELYGEKDKKKGPPLLKMARSHGLGIVPILQADKRLFRGSKRDPNTNDLRIIATAKALQHRESGKEVCLVTRDGGSRRAAFLCGLSNIGTLKMLWWSSRTMYIIQRTVKRLMRRVNGNGGNQQNPRRNSCNVVRS